MDPILFKCIAEGNMDKLQEIISEDFLLRQKTGDIEDTALHVAVQYESQSFVEVLCNRCPELLLRPNKKGDTALHMAAREGLTEIVEVLLSCAETRLTDVESGAVYVLPMHFLVRMSNNEMDTALHKAVRNGHVLVVNILLAADLEFKYFANRSGKAPLYLAVEQGSLTMVKQILENRSSSAEGPDGATALHSATRQSDDSIISQLLDSDRSLCYVRSANDGSISLHVAASKGNVEAMKTILKHCPDSWGILNNRGQNILHIAAESEMIEVIEYIFQRNQQMVKGLVNEQDNEGNTPFHLVAKTKTWTMIDKFKGNDIVKENIKNKENLTALDIIDVHVMELCQMIIEKEDDPWSDPEVKRRSGQAKTTLVVAALVSTFSFTAGITLPGGYIQDGERAGQALLSADSLFRDFVVMNSLVLAFSLFSVIMYCLVKVESTKSRIIRLYIFGDLTLGCSLGLLPWDFTLGCYSVLRSTGLISVIFSIFAVHLFAIFVVTLYK